jgi:hypothetical protein
MKVQNEPKVQIELKVVQFALVSTLILGVLTALVLFQWGVFSSNDAKAALDYVPSGDIEYASTDPFSTLTDGDTIYLHGKFYIDQDYTLHQYHKITLIADGTNSEIKIFSGNNIYLGDSSELVLLNNAKIKIVGKCDSTTAIYIGGVRVATCDGTGGTSFGDVNGGGGILPVEWLDARAELVSDSEVEIKWSTASEINNQYFLVQYSTNGSDWSDGKMVPSKADGGNSHEILDYSSSHYIAERAENLYFRIKQVDYDEQFDFSDIMIVNLQPEGGIQVSTLGNAKIQVSTEAPSLGSELKIYNTTGSLIINQNFENNEMISLPSPGVYIIEIVNGTNVQRIKHLVK